MGASDEIVTSLAFDPSTISSGWAAMIAGRSPAA